MGAAAQALGEQVRAASTSPPDDPAVREATYQALLLELRTLGEQFVEQPTHPKSEQKPYSGVLTACDH